MRTALVLALLLSTHAACGSDDTTVDTVGTIDEMDAPPPGARAQTRRLTVDMLEASVGVVAGDGVVWRIDNDTGKGGGGKIAAFEQSALGATLGRPDYHLVTEEPAQPDALYVKLMDDMARNICNEMVELDPKLPAAQRNLARFVGIDDTSDRAAIRENLRYLQLRFLGKHVTDDAGVAHLEAVFDAFATTQSVPTGSTQALEGWRGVCIALVVSPEFHIY